MQDLRGEIQKIAKFLGKTLTEDQLVKLTEHLRFDNFAKNETVNCEIGKEIGLMNNSGNFIRKGINVSSGALDCRCCAYRREMFFFARSR